MGPDDIGNLISGTVGAIGVFAFFSGLMIKGYLIPKTQYDDMKEDRNYWRSVADRVLTATEKVVPPIVEVGRRQ